MAIYGKTLTGIAQLVEILDLSSIGMQEDDCGFKIGDIPIETTDGDELIGMIEFDKEGHPTFAPVTELCDCLRVF